MPIFDEEKQKQKLRELREREEENLARILSDKYSVSYIDLGTVGINIDALRLIKEDVARKAKAAAFSLAGKTINIAVLSPNNPNTKEVLADLESRGYSPNIFMVSSQSLEKVWKYYKDLSFSFETKSGSLDVSNEEITEFLKMKKNIEDVRTAIKETLALKKGYRISKILEVVLAGAMVLEASDIHIEPTEMDVRLRFRLDGVLTDVARIDHETYRLLLSRIKLLSNLKLNVKSTPQDGRFSIKVRDSEIEIRTSILPEADNETVVLRILDPKAIGVPLEELGIHPRLLSILEREINKPNGMILTTGPTGSGKTTTLYAFLKKRYSPGIKVITIENPIEYHLDGIVQTQTNSEKGYTFLEGLRSALRQDPDVIMVGEIRDSETAEIAINAALTGHIVFSTLHTNNAAGTFPRLIDLGVNSKVITSAVNIVMAQRLIRRINKEQCQEVLIEGKDKEIVDRILSTIKDQTYLDGLQREKMWIPKEKSADVTFGYKGRVGIYEAILTDQKIEEIIETNPSERDVRAAAESQNLLTMEQDGIIKVLMGMTTIEELARVIDLGV